MSQKKRRHMISMKSEEVSSTNGIVGRNPDLLSIAAKANDDWIEDGAGPTFKHSLHMQLGALAANERTYQCAA